MKDLIERINSLCESEDLAVTDEKSALHLIRKYRLYLRDEVDHTGDYETMIRLVKDYLSKADSKYDRQFINDAKEELAMIFRYIIYGAVEKETDYENFPLDGLDWNTALEGYIRHLRERLNKHFNY